MTAVPFSDAAADAVAAALNGAGLGEGVTFTRSRWPKYALKDLTDGPKFHVVPVWPARLEPNDDNAGSQTETRVAVTIDTKCNKSDDLRVAELTVLLEAIAAFLAAKNVEGLGYPVEPLVADRNEEMLDQGHFCAGVGLVYRVFRNAPAGEGGGPVDEDFP